MRPVVIYRCRYYWPKHPYVPAIQGVITFFVIANFSLATFMDPGTIPKGKTAVSVEVRSTFYFSANF